MNNERIQQMLNGNYDEEREDTIRSMLSEFYSRKMIATAAIMWVIGLVLLGAAVWSAVAFFGTPTTQYQIMYATIFLSCFLGLGLLKIFAWQMLHKNSLKREIKRLELQVAELAAAFGKTMR